MSNTNTETQTEAPAAKAVVPKQKKLKPARKQVKPGDVDKETAPQTGKEYSACLSLALMPSKQIALMAQQTYGTTSGLAVIERTTTPSACSLLPLRCVMVSQLSRK